MRLGGFHTLMAYLGAIGYIMRGSGLEDLWATVYAKNSIEEMLNGKAYKRAIRAHMLTFEVLGIEIFKEVNREGNRHEFQDYPTKALDKIKEDNCERKFSLIKDSKDLAKITEAFLKKNGVHKRTAWCNCSTVDPVL